jgi:hypothetical protein
MKNQKGFISPILIIISLLILALVAYFFSLKSISFQVPIKTQKSEASINSKGCSYYGKDYLIGEQFKSIDGCNGCTCEETQISCTEMACQ